MAPPDENLAESLAALMELQDHRIHRHPLERALTHP